MKNSSYAFAKFSSHLVYTTSSIVY